MILIAFLYNFNNFVTSFLWLPSQRCNSREQGQQSQSDQHHNHNFKHDRESRDHHLGQLNWHQQPVWLRGASPENIEALDSSNDWGSSCWTRKTSDLYVHVTVCRGWFRVQLSWLLMQTFYIKWCQSTGSLLWSAAVTTFQVTPSTSWAATCILVLVSECHCVSPWFVI